MRSGDFRADNDNDNDDDNDRQTDKPIALPLAHARGEISHIHGVYLFTGLDHWTGILDWTTGLTFDPKNGTN